MAGNETLDGESGHDAEDLGNFWRNLVNSFFLLKVVLSEHLVSEAEVLKSELDINNKDSLVKKVNISHKAQWLQLGTAILPF